MNNRKPKLHPFEDPTDASELLANRYGQLLRWAIVLTRGNTGKTEEIVQEFCVYIAVAKPDLGGVANLDGYLNTCLWTGMDSHATGLEAELRSLHAQLAAMWSIGNEPAAVNRQAMSIDDPVNEANLNASIRTIIDTIPLEQAEDVVVFTTRLSRLERNQQISAQTR